MHFLFGIRGLAPATTQNQPIRHYIDIISTNENSPLYLSAVAHHRHRVVESIRGRAAREHSTTVKLEVSIDSHSHQDCPVLIHQPLQIFLVPSAGVGICDDPSPLV